MSKVKLQTPSVAARRDLVVLAADKDAQEALDGLLGNRTKSLQIRDIKYDIEKHPQHDPGCLLTSAGILTPFAHTHKYAIVVFDYDGCGRSESTRKSLEIEVETVLAKVWDGRIAVIVIDPELEAWIWTKPSHIPDIIGWPTTESLPEWLVENAYLDSPTQAKPVRPKEAFEAALREVRKPRSSATFRRIAEKVSFGKCTDPAFLKLLTTLRKWFPATA